MKFYDLNNNNAFLFESKNDNFDIYECVKKGKKILFYMQYRLK